MRVHMCKIRAEESLSSRFSRKAEALLFAAKLARLARSQRLPMSPQFSICATYTWNPSTHRSWSYSKIGLFAWSISRNSLPRSHSVYNVVHATVVDRSSISFWFFPRRSCCCNFMKRLLVTILQSSSRNLNNGSTFFFLHRESSVTSDISESIPFFDFRTNFSTLGSTRILKNN